MRDIQQISEFADGVILVFIQVAVRIGQFPHGFDQIKFFLWGAILMDQLGEGLYSSGMRGFMPRRINQFKDCGVRQVEFMLDRQDQFLMFAIAEMMISHSDLNQQGGKCQMFLVVR